MNGSAVSPVPDGPDVLFPVPGVDGDECLHVPHSVELGGHDVWRGISSRYLSQLVYYGQVQGTGYSSVSSFGFH